MSDDDSNSERARLRALERALNELDRLSDKLDLSRAIKQQATEMYRDTRQEGELPGRGIEEVVAGALYLACRQKAVAKTPDDFAEYSEYSRKEILRTAKFLEEIIDIAVPPGDPHEYVRRYADELDLDDKTIKKALDIVENSINEGIRPGSSPTGMAAGAIYAAGQLEGNKVTQNEVSNAAGVTNVTVRNQYQDQLDAFTEENG